MSLQVWLPLISNTSNIGASSISGELSHSSITYETGKIGNAIRISNYMTSTATYSGIANKINWSICVWLKLSSSDATPSYQDFFTIGLNNGGETSGGFRIEHTNASGNFQIVVPKSTTYGPNTNGWYTFYSDSASCKDKWAHIVVINDGINFRTYINGVLKNTIAISTFTPTTSMLTGTVRLGLEGAYCWMNDLRIYDHCLSKREIHEISKGLVCHYLLNNNGSGMPNLVAGTSCNEVQYTYPSEGFADRWAATTPAVPSASQYTLSFFAKSTVNGDQIRAHWYNPNTTTRCESSQGVVTTSGDGCINIALSTEWKFYWIVYTQSETTAVKHLILPRMGRSDIAPGTGIVSIKCVKLEEGNKATPWCPYTSDASYSIFNMNSDKEIDASGYENHGTKSGTITYNSDTPRNSICTKFSNDTYIRINPMPSISGYANSYTFSWWGNYNSTAAKMMWGYQNGNRLNLYLNSGKFFWNTSDGNNNPFGSISSDEYLNKWHHFAVTGDGTITKLYIDGVFKANATTYRAITGTDLIFNGWNTGNDYDFNGSLSDFRLYSTVLSATDILELYNAPINFNKHSVMTQGEFIEK